jgi:hypothetical protein
MPNYGYALVLCLHSYGVYLICSHSVLQANKHKSNPSRLAMRKMAPKRQPAGMLPPPCAYAARIKESTAYAYALVAKYTNVRSLCL